MKTLFSLVLLAAASSLAAQLPWYPTDTCEFQPVACDWLAIDSTDSTQLWQLGRVQKPYFGVASPTDFSMVTDTAAAYGANQRDFFELRFPKVYNWYDYECNYLNYELHFRHKYQTDSLYDGGYILVSFDTGTTWVNMAESLDAAWTNGFVDIDWYGLYRDVDTLADGTPAFQGTSDWRWTSLVWITFIPVRSSEESPDVWLRFYFQSDSVANNLDGWMIDEIVLGFPDVGNSLISIADTEDVRLFPNPCGDKLWVQTTGKPRNYRILDAQGRTLQSGVIASELEGLSTELLPSGFYFLHLQDDESVGTFSFVK